MPPHIFVTLLVGWPIVWQNLLMLHVLPLVRLFVAIPIINGIAEEDIEEVQSRQIFFSLWPLLKTGRQAALCHLLYFAARKYVANAALPRTRIHGKARLQLKRDWGDWHNQVAKYCCVHVWHGWFSLLFAWKLNSMNSIYTYIVPFIRKPLLLMSSVRKEFTRPGHLENALKPLYQDCFSEFYTGAVSITSLMASHDQGMFKDEIVIMRVMIINKIKSYWPESRFKLPGATVTAKSWNSANL